MSWTQLSDGTLQGLTDESVQKLLSGDAQIPRFFMTGDGHRSPPFRWIESCAAVKSHFEKLLIDNRLCAHVEQFASEVSAKSVPDFLKDLHGKGRILGWELPIFRELLPSMDSSRELAESVEDMMSDRLLAGVTAFEKEMVRLKPLLEQIGSPDKLTKAVIWSAKLVLYFTRVKNGIQPKDAELDKVYQTYLITYHNDCMKLRTQVHPFIGVAIWTNIKKFPDSTHIITCGNQHLTCGTDRLTAFVPIGNDPGVWDASQH